ncbi:sigma-54-dependent Fis family transcriptional regulator [Thalassotalea sp. M1531]|uniref:Sigma-54-dependent Fis family transcriptional regulator n=1 Tax=Thalassotalea algicola TaxID=2716224 RepID=A0A7Y0LAR7_9GAMM|nr:sigma-54 dependent transcriptional regulator [Thalassotalea algicola]NMP31095.1 sigma-54-dependent Fis family transcriptional regulator [Thalassotalea algicola]
MKQDAHILIVDDDEDILVAGKLLLKRKFEKVSICNRPEQLPNLLTDNEYDVILLDMNFGPGESSGEQGFYWLQQILTRKPEAIVIMITAHGGIDVAVEAIKQGATDFIAKPWHNEKVIATVTTACELKRTRNEAQQLKATNQALVQAVQDSSTNDSIIGNSAAMQEVYSIISKAAPTDANVLILGENGTGKELVAKEIHKQSKRSEQVFLSVDLGALTETLFESELFGHTKGAFTGAQQDRVGKIKAADGGTLFLDEIGNLPLHLQAKLLTVLAQREVTPVGSNKAIPFNVRIVAATNIDKSVLSDELKFRQDLLFRLNTVEVQLPPLSARTEDIQPIAQYYISLYCKKYQKNEMALSPGALAAIIDYQWPGNIRALRHAVERAVILAQSDTLTEYDFQLAPLQPKVNSSADANRQDFTLPKQLNLDDIEKQAISQALKKHGYNISHSAKELGLTRAALYRRMEKHGL